MIKSSLEPEWTVYEPHFKNLKPRHESDPENGWGAMEGQQKKIIEDNNYKVIVKYGHGGSCTLYGAETGEVISPFSTIKDMQDFKKKNNLIIVKNSRENNIIKSSNENNRRPVKSALDKNKQFTLTQSEREALEVMLSFVTGAYGDDEECAKFKVVRDSLTPEEIEQIDDLCMYVLADEQNYKTISSRQIKDDMELLNKVYNLLDNNNLLDEEWDAINAFEKIALE